MSSTVHPIGLLSSSATVKPTGPNQVLASTPSRPSPRPTYDNPIYAARNTSGLYDAVAKQIEDMHLEALANLDYPETITRQIEDWSKNYKYLDIAGNELRVAVVGEILGPASGTIIRAHGNYYARDGDTFKPIDDRAKIKDTIAIGVPSAATTMMYNTVFNQNICAGQIVAHNADEDKRKGIFPIVKNWTKASVEGREQHDIMTLHMLPKYGIPSAAGAPKVKRTAKRRLDEVDDAATPVKEEEVVAVPGSDDIKLGAYYEPELLPDFGGDYFNLVKAKLVQHDVRDVDSNLVPPWKIYDALKPGTLILALVSLHCFCMVDTSRKEPKDRRIYQMNAHSIRILAESDELVEERTRPVAPIGSSRAVSSMPVGPSVASFDKFVVPKVNTAGSAYPSTSTLAATSVGSTTPVASTSATRIPSGPSAAALLASAVLGEHSDEMDVDDGAHKKPKSKRVKKDVAGASAV